MAKTATKTAQKARPSRAKAEPKLYTQADMDDHGGVGYQNGWEDCSKSFEARSEALDMAWKICEKNGNATVDTVLTVARSISDFLLEKPDQPENPGQPAKE